MKTTYNILGIEVKPIEYLLSDPGAARSIGYKYGFYRDAQRDDEVNKNCRLELCMTLKEATEKIEKYFNELWNQVGEYFVSEETNNHPLIKWHTCEVENRGMQLYGLIGVDITGKEYIANAYWDGENEPEIESIETR